MHATGTTTSRHSKHCTLEGGTDAGSMVLFDPTALPADFDAKIRNGEVAETMDELGKLGRLYWLNTEGDGGYSLAVCLAEHLPPTLQPYAKPRESVPAFHIPTGRLYFTGVEYLFQQEDSILRKYPHMGNSTDVPPGVYSLDLYDLEYPENFHESMLRQRVTRSVARTYFSFNRLAATAVLAGLAALVSAFVMKVSVWATTMLPAAAVLIAFTILISRSIPYRRAAEACRRIEGKYPGYAAVLRPTEPSTLI